MRDDMLATRIETVRNRAIEECAQAIEKGVLPWDDGEFAKACRYNAREIRALLNQKDASNAR